MYVLVRSLDFANEKEEQSEALGTNKINRFRHLRRDLIVARSSLSIDAKIYSLLKHDIYRRFFLIDIAIAHNTLYKVLCHFYIVRIGTRVSSNVSSPSRQDIVNKSCTIFRSDAKDMKTHSSQRTSIRL